MTPDVSAISLSKHYGKVHALREVSVEIGKGELFGFIGPDGAGKTSLFRILTSLLKPDGGSASVLGLDVVKDYRKLRTKFGYMPGRFSLYTDLTVEENLNFFAAVFNTTVEENYDLIRDIYVQIEPFAKRRAGALSGGMKQKLALSCALIHRPEILFLDEPTTGVDAVSRREFWDMLGNLNAAGMTIVVSTPYMDEAARCSRIALMQEGRILDTDTPSGIVEHFPVPLYAVSAPDRFALLNALRDYPESRSVYPFGDSVHYTFRMDGEEAVSGLRHHLNTHGVEADIRRIDPSIEDVFLDLMESRETEEAP